MSEMNGSAAGFREKFAELSRPEALHKEPIDIPEIGPGVFVREMTGGDGEDYETLLYRNSRDGEIVDMHGIKCLYLVKCLVNENGERIFSDDDLPLVRGLPSRIVNPIAELASTINRTSSKDLEDLEKNSQSARASASGTS